MSSYKVNYSELVTALQDHKQGKANRLLKQLLPNLKTYLVAVMNAQPEDAEEAVHRAFLNTYEKILKDEIKNKKFVFKYLLRACRNEYVRFMKEQKRFSSIPSGIDEMGVAPAEQISNLLDEDRQRILKQCLQELPKKSRPFIEYILQHPDASSKSLSEYFDISRTNARIKKMRIIDDLSHCVKKKWEE